MFIGNAIDEDPDCNYTSLHTAGNPAALGARSALYHGGENAGRGRPGRNIVPAGVVIRALYHPRRSCWTHAGESDRSPVALALEFRHSLRGVKRLSAISCTMSM
jgi:hypothetical protein